MMMMIVEGILIWRGRRVIDLYQGRPPNETKDAAGKRCDEQVRPWVFLLLALR